MRQLILVHGRSQEDKGANALKAAWLGAWSRGLAKSGLTNPLPDDLIRFPYYGDTLKDLVDGSPAGDAAEVVVRGLAPPPDVNPLMMALIEEIAEHAGVTAGEIRAELDGDVISRGPQNWGWVQAVLGALDKVKPVSKALVSLVTKDVSVYLTNGIVARTIDQGVRDAVLPQHDAVVVSHSLGTVVAYNALTGRTGPAPQVVVPLFVTLGSPLGINAINTRLAPHPFPSIVATWYNAMDEDDLVSLYPLTKRHFKTGGTIRNNAQVENWTDNQHGIEGYLDDAEVARTIYDAVVA